MGEKLRALTPWLAALGGNVIWGFSYLFTRTALKTAAPELLLSHRFLLAFFCVNLPVLLGREKLRFRGKKPVPLLLLCLTEPLCFYFESYGILYSNATFAGIVLAAVPVVSLLLAALFLREYPSRRQLCFCMLPILGVVLITASGSRLGIVRPLGVFLLLCSCLSSAAYKTANRGASQAYTPFERTYCVLLACAVVFTLGAWRQAEGSLWGYLAPLGEASYLLSLLALSLLCSLCANLLINYAAGRMKVLTLSTFGAVSTVCTLLGGVVFLREPITWAMALGTGFILTGVRQTAKAE